MLHCTLPGIPRSSRLIFSNVRLLSVNYSNNDRLSVKQKLEPYFQLGRYDKPVGSWLLFWPGCWSITLASFQELHSMYPDPLLMSKFAVGSVIMRGAGCTINDMLDSKFDSQVERTKTRPIARGALSHKQALKFLALQLTAGLGILLSLNNYSIVLGASSMFLVCTYPLMKRYTWFPQLFLGLTFNWGALLGWTAVVGNFGDHYLAPISLYVGSICWTMVYDTIYAHQDKEDDARIGVKSTALYFGDTGTVPALKKFTILMGLGFAGAGWFSGITHPAFYALSAAIPTARIYHQLNTVNLQDREDCNQVFKSNIALGSVILSGIVASNLI
jgi:4-hydroxybenzoate polyprenyltransferase